MSYPDKGRGRAEAGKGEGGEGSQQILDFGPPIEKLFVFFKLYPAGEREGRGLLKFESEKIGYCWLLMGRKPIDRPQPDSGFGQGKGRKAGGSSPSLQLCNGQMDNKTKRPLAQFTERMGWGIGPWDFGPVAKIEWISRGSGVVNFVL